MSAFSDEAALGGGIEPQHSDVDPDAFPGHFVGLACRAAKRRDGPVVVQADRGHGGPGRDSNLGTLVVHGGDQCGQLEPEMSVPHEQCGTVSHEGTGVLRQDLGHQPRHALLCAHDRPQCLDGREANLLGLRNIKQLDHLINRRPRAAQRLR